MPPTYRTLVGVEERGNTLFVAIREPHGWPAG